MNSKCGRDDTMCKKYGRQHLYMYVVLYIVQCGSSLRCYTYMPNSNATYTIQRADKCQHYIYNMAKMFTALSIKFILEKLITWKIYW